MTRRSRSGDSGWWLAILTAGFALMAQPAGAQLVGSQPAGVQSDAVVAIGKAIYHTAGTGLKPEIAVRLRGSDEMSSPRKFACAACHGLTGQGGAEAGVRPPPIEWKTLAVLRTGQDFGRKRPPYDRASLKRAIILGIDATGSPLGSGMPRYRMSDAQFEALFAYLGILGTAADIDPGIRPTSIKLGTALPMTGSMAAIGEDIAATLRACFDEVNASGGIYGRRIDLMVMDSRGEPDETVAATKRLIDNEAVFALVGNFLPGDQAALDTLITAAEIPLLGPISQAPREAAVSGTHIWHLLPTLSDQARVLIDYALAVVGRRKSQGPLRAALVYANTADSHDAAQGAQQQLALRGGETTVNLVFDPATFSAADATRLVMSGSPDWIFFFGGVKEIETFAEYLAANQPHPPALAALTMLSPTRNLPAAITANMVMAAPAEPADAARLDGLATLLRQAGHSVDKPAFQVIAYAACKVLVEAMTRSGRQLGRASLMDQLERLRGFETGVLPPVSFAPARRVGVRGASIVGIDAATGLYVPMGGWRLPTD